MPPRNRQNPKSRFGAWTLSAAAIAGMMSPAAIIAPARAVVLNDWMFDPASQAVSLTLPSGITPDFFLLAEPARIILEIPNTTLGTVTAAEQYSGAVSSIRLTEVAGGSRLVLELAPNTRLDPRHAELMATDLGNGQTEWVLQPLLQDAPTVPIATAPVPSRPAAADTPEVAAPESSAPAASVAAPRAAIADPPASTIADESSEMTPSEPVEAMATADDVAAAEDEVSAADAPAVTIAVEPPASSVSDPVAAPLPAPASLPDIATSATTGAVRSLPTGPDPLSSVSTDAAVLSGAISDNLSDQPPAELPLDPFMAGASSTVSVPSLAEADRTPAPAVAVPPLATVPAASPSAAPPPNQPLPSTTASAPNQVRPPSRAGAPVAPSSTANVPTSRPSVAPPPTSPVPSVTAAGVVPEQIRPPSSQNRPSESSSVAATLPPESTVRPPVVATNRPSESLPAESAIRPPTTTAAARPDTLPVESTMRPPVAAANRPESLPAESTMRPPTTTASRPDTLPVEATIRPPGAETARQAAPDVVAANSLEIPTLPSPPDHWREPGNRAIAPNEVRPPTEAGVPTQVPNVAPRSERVTTAAIAAPPFLTDDEAESETATNALSNREQPSIPPPPPIPRGSGPLPFGEPLPASRP